MLKEGDILKRPELAQTLKTIAQDGIDAFYDGSLTDTIIQEINDAGNAKQIILNFLL